MQVKVGEMVIALSLANGGVSSALLSYVSVFHGHFCTKLCDFRWSDSGLVHFFTCRVPYTGFTILCNFRRCDAENAFRQSRPGRFLLKLESPIYQH